MFDPNYICLIGLLPFMYSSFNNDTNVHSLSVLFFGLLFHSFKSNKLLKYLDIIQCFMNGTFVFYSHSPSRIFGFLTLFTYLTNTYYLNSNYIHVLLQLLAWRGISLYENKLTN